ncbi:MAG: HAD family phosphatase [Novosphingobium sp.]|nr:HAD family phosphatase [Novosphingobium sp.]
MSADIRAVVFDVGRVLFEWDLRHLFAPMIGDPDQLEWFVGNVVTEDWHFEQDAGRPLSEMVPERIARFPKHADLIRAYATHFNDSIPGPVPGSLELVEALDEAGVPLFAITNFGADFWPGFRAQWPVFDRFRDIVVSGDEKIVKPDPAIYRLAQSRFGFAPAEMLFVDDKAENIAAAEALGWQGHRFTGADRLGADLRDRGLIR